VGEEEEATVSSEAEENKAIVRRFEEELAKGNLDVIDELLSPDFVDRSLMPGQGPTREDYKLSMKESNDAFPITSITIEEQVAEGDTLQLSPVWSDRTVTEGERRRSEWRR
jgi:ketosteroid isomerase-like protein